MNTTEFAPLPYRRRHLAAGGSNVYRIVPTEGEPVKVVAANASEAFKKSGLARVLKIIRESHENTVVLAKGMLVEEAPPPAVSETPEAIAKVPLAAAPAPETAAPSVPEKPLTEEEVKKLLGEEVR